ncbi:hydroxysqualene dehydroxylase [Streptomyces griseorubiginosus]|uniref:tRNA 5-methylaminomethyl-2-thiouridine biosynthesis bifunctional protein MnmC n=1 Tax=Streptomyces griseorubiginosus TaxID=67304 RepID=A0AAI8PN87_9ACTN|nr:FAD-dependent oxidoreductase [Streptomyces griseorubiginosus]AYC40128.1 tRNA 5-methylaminomethyl-2-thiouridine biosynthesis bifunctional protein MnmC [Streptomyces griseorubiginosus]
MGRTGSTRRTFVVGAAAAGGAVALGTGTAASAAPAQGRQQAVAVLGGGVAGLTAAHELAERGFAVTVYERRALGGKARSMDVLDSGKGGRKPLPAEHGFRFIPGIYHNLPDTMRRIPFPGNAGGVRDNLIAPKEMMFARNNGREDLRIPIPGEKEPAELTLDDIRRALTGLLETGFNLPLHEIAYFVNRAVVFLTSCDARRNSTWEDTPWWTFVRAGQMSKEYQRILAVGITRNIVATKAEVASTRTVGTLGEAFVFNALGRGADGPPDRILNAPTNEAWIDPWVAHLSSLGVTFRIGWTVHEVKLGGDGLVSEAVIEDADGVLRSITADHYVSAMPVEHARRTWSAGLRAADPQLARCDQLRTDWMTGIQFYLTETPPLVQGHFNCIDSPWSLTAIAQARHWPGRDFAADYGDGVAKECLSVDISEWDKPGVLYGKTAKQCTREEVAREVWAQLKDALNDTGRTVLRDGTLHSWFLDPGVDGIGTPHPTNQDELLIHPVGTLYNRPSARTAVPNFFLSGDYVAVDIDLATMEGANASARQAVNALLDQAGSSAPRCTVTPLFRPPELESLKRHDHFRFKAGLPNVFDLG